MQSVAKSELRFAQQDPRSILLVTLDSCRYDAFIEADAPNIRAIGPVHRAMAPGLFTYSSHAAMFMGFTPSVASLAEPYVNPKFGKILRVTYGGFRGNVDDFVKVRGRNVIDGLKKSGYRTLGSGAVGWLNPRTTTGKQLTCDFDEFFHAGSKWGLRLQLQWFAERLQEAAGPAMVFLNIGETHVPYYHEGAAWSADVNPCIPFADDNDAAECRRRQVACISYVDSMLEPLLQSFCASTVIVCADHGDCWGEDGLWEHGVCHPKVLEVPLVYRLGERPDLMAAGV